MHLGSVKRGVVSKVVAFYLSLCILVSPFSAVIAAQQVLPVDEIKTPLEKVISIPQVLVDDSLLPDISQINWQQKITIDGKQVTLSSKEALKSIDLDPSIEKLVEMYQSDLDVLDRNVLMFPSIKAEKKKHITEGLQYTIAAELIEKGKLPKNYFELKAQGQLMDAAQAINVSKAPALSIDGTNIVGVSNPEAATIVGIKTVQASERSKKGETSVVSSLINAVSGAISSVVGFVGDQINRIVVNDPKRKLIKNEHDAAAWRKYLDERVEYLQNKQDLPASVLEKAVKAQSDFESFLTKEKYISEPKGEITAPKITFGGTVWAVGRALLGFILPKTAYAYIFGNEDFESCSTLPCSFDDDYTWGSVATSLDHTNKVSGVDSLKAVVTGEGGGSMAKDGFATNEIRVQFKVFVPNPMTFGGSGYAGILMFQDGSDLDTLWLNIEDWGTPHLTVAGDVLSYTDTGLDLVEGAVNTIELRAKIGASTGDVDIWLNNSTEGSPDYNGSGSMNTGTDNIDLVLAGLVYAPENGVSTLYFDDVIVNNLFIGAGATNSAPTAPTAMLTESQTNPTNVTDTTPEFSAIYNDSDTGDLANKYRLQVSTSTTFAMLKWDSGTTTMATTTAGNRSPDITYAGSTLATSTTYYWRIKFIDDSDAAGAWSTATSTFIVTQIEGNSTTTQAALEYLIDHQNADGSWGNASTTFITTIATLDALFAYGETGTSYQSGLEWIDSYAVKNNDFFAQKIREQLRADLATSTDIEVLVNSIDQFTGGFPFKTNYPGDPLTTSNVLQALDLFGYEDLGDNPDLTTTLALYYLTQTQRFDEGWSVFDHEGLSTISVTSKVIEALVPHKGQIINGFGSPIAINDTLNSAVNTLKANQLTNGTWGNNILDTAFAFYSLKKAIVPATYATTTVAYFQTTQEVNGSWNNDLYTTSQVLKALMVPEPTAGDLSIDDIVPLTSLQNGTTTSASIRFDITNNGEGVVTSGILHLIADGYQIGTFDFEDSSISIDPDETVQITVSIPNTIAYIGDVLFEASVEGVDNILYPNSYYQETLTFSANPNGYPALPFYFAAQKAVFSGQPAVRMIWNNKTDSNRLNYVMLWRSMGSTTWDLVPIPNNLSSAFIYGGFAEDQTYEITFGTVAQDGTRYHYYSGADQIVQVKTSSTAGEYAAGSVSGTLMSSKGPIPNISIYTSGEVGSGSTDENGDFSIIDAAWGRGRIKADNFRYKDYVTLYTTADTSTTSYKAYTDLIPDTEDPEITYLGILGEESDFEMENLERKYIQAGVDDDIGGTYGIVESATFSYYDPNDSAWHVIGTKAGPLSTTFSYTWDIPGSLLGSGYKIKVVARDYSGKESDPYEWGPFEITQGNESPSLSFVTSLPIATSTADLTHTISWIDSDPDDNATILFSYDPDQESGNANHTNIVYQYEDDAANQYVWDTSNVATGTYYIWALLIDGHNTNQVIYSPEPITITHSAPTAPSTPFAEGQTNPTNITDSTPEFSAIYKDPNSGDIATHYRVQVSATSTFSTIYWDSTKTALASSTSLNARIADVAYAGSSLASSTTYYWRIKFYDTAGHEGAYSTTTATFSLAAAATSTNSAPTSPSSLQAEGQVNPTSVTDSTPEFSAIFNDPNGGDSASKYRIQVSTSSAFATIKWDSGTTTMATTSVNSRSPDISYAGSALASSTTYYWRVAFVDVAGLGSPWSTTTSSFVLAASGVSTSTITLAATSTSISTGYSGTVTKTWSHTVSGSDPVIVLTADLWQDVAGSGVITSAKWNGGSFTKAGTKREGGMQSEIWYLVATTTGSKTMSVTVTGDTDAIKLAASTFIGVDQSSPLVATSSANGGSGNPSASITNTLIGNIVIATLSRYTNTNANTNRSSIYKSTAGSTLGAASYQLSTTTGTHSDTYTGSSANDWSIMIATFKPAVH